MLRPACQRGRQACCAQLATRGSQRASKLRSTAVLFVHGSKQPIVSANHGLRHHSARLLARPPPRSGACQRELESWATSSPRETRRWSSKQREDPAPENSSSWPAALNDALSARVMSTVVPGAGHALQLYSDTKRLQPPRVGRQPEPPHLTSRQKGLTRSARASSCSAFLPSTEGHTICLNNYAYARE